VSYAELSERVATLAATLQARGLQPGDRVALFLESSVEFAVAVHAVLRAGGTFMPISPLTRQDKLAYMLDDTRAAVLVTQQRLAAHWEPALDRSASVHTCIVRDAPGAAGRIVDWPHERTAPVVTRPRIDQDLAAIIYTSGTTGVPKGVMLTHLNMRSAWTSVQAYLGLRDDDVIGLALSPSFSYGLYYLLMGLGLGATVVIERAASFPVKVVEGLARERVTVFPGVPTLYSAILGLSTLRDHDLSALRILTNAAAALPVGHVERLRELLPRAKLFSMYGMTECKRISYLPPEELERRPDSVGRGMPNQECWLVDAQGQRLPPGSVGELVVRGAHVMRGYWDKPAETAERLRPGPYPGEQVLHTGDIFRSDADGFLYFVARSDDIIKSRGEKVSPREVENAIYAIDGVVDCAVIGMPDPLLGEAVKAFVTVREGADLTERAIIRHCLATLESYMAPKQVVFVDDLPRTDSGKIRKRDLR
jgi:long-chain acyl-CoA synthetase